MALTAVCQQLQTPATSHLLPIPIRHLLGEKLDFIGQFIWLDHLCSWSVTQHPPDDLIETVDRATKLDATVVVVDDFLGAAPAALRNCVGHG